MAKQPFSAWLRQQMKDKRLSLRDVALFSGVQHTTILRIKAGAVPRVDTADAICRGLNEYYVLGLKKEPR